MANTTAETPKPQPTTSQVTVRLRLSKEEYKAARRLSVELDRPVGELLREGTDLMFRRYQAMGIATQRQLREEACDD